MMATQHRSMRLSQPGPRGRWPAAAVAVVMCGPLVGAARAASASPAAPPRMGASSCAKAPSNYYPQEPQGPPQSKVRVANFYLNPNGTPGAALDLYDTQSPSKKDKPLVSGLGYGRISPYVAPRAGSNPKYVTTDYGDLYMFQHGCRFPSGTVDGLQNGTPLQEAGWVKGQQETVVVADGTDGLATNASYFTIMEVEPKGHGNSMVSKASQGMGVLFVNAFGLISGSGKVGNAYVRIDGHCTTKYIVTNQNGNSNNGVLGAAVAANVSLKPGSHKIEVVASSSPGLGLSLSQCNQATALATTSVKISANTPTMLFLYGPNPQHAKFLVAALG